MVSFAAPAPVAAAPRIDEAGAMAMEGMRIGGGGLALPDPLPPLLIVDLDDVPPVVATAPPPCPLIGLGDPDHPAATLVDAVVEPPVTLDVLVAGVCRAPRAAAALVQLLRATERARPRDALTAESLCLAMLQGSAEHRAWLAEQAGAAAAPSGALAIARHGDRLLLRIDRPWALNAIDRLLRDALHDAFVLATLDPDIAAIRLTAAGRCFSVGADLGEFGTTRDPATAHAIRMATLPALPLIACADRLEVGIRGACVGAGLEIAAFAGRVTVGPDAWFQLPELAMGIVPGAGGTVSIPRRIGRRRAALMMLSGRRIGARTALAWGLIDAIVDAAPVDEYGADEG